MTNLTISLDETIVRQARMRAIGQGTSVSAKIREFLASYASGAATRTSGDATADLLRMMGDVRAEIAQNKNQSAKTKAPTDKVTTPKRRTLRDETYEGDYRARSRITDAWRDANGAPRV